MKTPASVPPRNGGMTPATAKADLIVRQLVTASLSRSSLSRAQVAESMSSFLGETVTLRMLNAYTSGCAEQHRFPLQYLEAFCVATADWSLLSEFLRAFNYEAIGPDEQPVLALGRQYLAQKRAAAKLAKLEKELAEVEL